MAISQLTTANTFSQWLTATTQLIAFANNLTDFGTLNTNASIYLTGTGVSLNVEGTGLINVLRSNSINTRTLNVVGPAYALNVNNSVWVGDKLFVSDNISVGNNLIVTRNVTVGNLIVTGSQTIVTTSYLNLDVSGYVTVGSYIRQTGGNSSFAGQTAFSNAVTSLTAAGNVAIAGNVSIDRNLVVLGNANVAGTINTSNLIAVNANIRTLNATSINTISLNVTSNLVVGGTLSVTSLNVTNLSISGGSSNLSTSNISVTNLVNTRNLIVTGSVLSDLRIDGNVRVNSPREMNPGNGQLTIVGNGYTAYASLNATGLHIGHNSSSRNLTLDVDNTARVLVNTSQTTVTGNLVVGGFISGNGAGLTSVNWTYDDTYVTDVQMLNPANPSTWVTGASSTVFVPTGIDTIDIGIYLEVLVANVSSPIGATALANATGNISVTGSFGSTSGSGKFTASNASIALDTDFGYGPGSPEMRYRVTRDSTAIFTSDWLQLSVPGAFAFLVNTVRDKNPATSTNSTYAIDYMWRNMSSNPDAAAGSITVSKTSYEITGVGTNFSAFLGPRQRIVMNAVGATGPDTLYIAEVLSPTNIRLTYLPGNNYTSGSYTISDPNTKANAIQKSITFNFTGYRT
jgi:hypothetical protein